jgi:hypothetical protein
MATRTYLPMVNKLGRGSVKPGWLVTYTVVIIILAIILPRYQLTLPVGSPNFGSTPITVAAVCLPWPVGVIAAIAKGIAVTMWGGEFLIEFPAGIGDALMVILTAWLVRRVRRNMAVIAGQVSRLVFTSGVVAVVLGVLVATGSVSPGLSPIGNLTSSAWQNIVIIWKAITYPAVLLSIGVNIVGSLFAVWLFGDIIELTLYKKV